MTWTTFVFIRFVKSNIKLFVDETYLYLNVDNPVNAAEIMNWDLPSIIDKWSNDRLVTFNALKVESMHFTCKMSSPE